MIIREVLPTEKKQFNLVATHPLQTWEWGEFRQKTGKQVIRLGAFEGKTLRAGYQLTVHPLPKTNYSLLYFPKGPLPDETALKAFVSLGQQKNALLVKMIPNIAVGQEKEKVAVFKKNPRVKLVKPFFFEHTFQIDLTQSEEALLAAMHPKTRYNIRLANRHGVKVVEDNSDQAFKIYLRLMEETTKRQHFYAHTPEYHQKMWETLRPAGLAHLLLARYRQQVLVAWILFTLNQTLYYPYGASSREHKEVMAGYAMMWEAIRFGKKMGCTLFDLWGCLGPNPNPRNPWFGFHRFKAGFGGQLVKFIGTYDLVINPTLYPIYNLANEIRWKFLKLKTHLPFR